MSFISWSTKQHSISGTEVESIIQAIQKAGSVELSFLQKPENSRCELSDDEIKETIRLGNEAYDGLDWVSAEYHFGKLLNAGVKWIPFVRARYALAQCHFASMDQQFAPLFDIVLDTYGECPGDSSSYLVMALLKSNDKLYRQALQWLHFSSLTNGCSISIHQHVSDIVQFRIKCYRADIDSILPHLLKPSRLTELKNGESGINFKSVESILERIRSDSSYLEQVWDNEDFVALVDLACSQYEENKWYLYLDEDVSTQGSHFTTIDDDSFLKIFNWVNWRDLIRLSMTSKSISNRCKSCGPKSILLRNIFKIDAKMLSEYGEYANSVTASRFECDLQLLDELLMALKVASEEDLKKAEAMVLMYGGSKFIHNSPLMCTPFELGHHLLMNTLPILFAEQGGSSIFAFTNLIVSFTELLFRPNIRVPDGFQASAIALLCFMASSGGESGRTIREMLRNSDICELSVLFSHSHLGRWCGLLHSLVNFGDTIDFKHSYVGHFEADEALEPELKQSQFTPGVWHFTSFQISTPFSRVPEIGVMRLSELEGASEPGILVGDLVTSHNVFAVVIRSNGRSSQIAFKKGAGFDGVDPESLLHTDLVCSCAHSAYIVGGVYQSEHTSAWMAYRDIRPFEEDWFDGTLENIKQAPKNLVTVPENIRQAFTDFYVWGYHTARQVHRLSRWSLCSVWELDSFEAFLKSIHPGCLEGEMLDLTTIILRGPFETHDQHARRCHLLVASLYFLNELRTQIVKGFESDAERILAVPASQLNDLLPDVLIWRRLLHICPLLNPNDVALQSDNLQGYIQHFWDLALQDLARSQEQEHSQEEAQLISSLVKKSHKSKSGYSLTSMTLFGLSLLAAASILSYGSFKLGKYFWSNKK